MERKREAGALLHVSSLPSQWGVGDLGPEAYHFIDFLESAGLGVWQVLPLNPTLVESGNSPYYCPSVFAGNTLFLSPELMVRDGWLDGGDLESPPVFSPGRTDYTAAAPWKESLLDRAAARFTAGGGTGGGTGDESYTNFCRENAYWLDDYSAFMSLRRKMSLRGWFDWPADLRERDGKALEAAGNELAAEMVREKFGQYLFFRQWNELKSHARAKGVKIFGDLPIYPTHDSTDVWAHPSYFKLDKEFMPRGVAGVPPDYFSETGQLWGNPVYDWKALEDDGFRWWVRRVEHNLKLFDYLRIDHFRGLAAFWEVPAGEKTGINGRWEDVPSEELFAAIFRAVPVESIIAEDLGTITPDVVALRKKFAIPGMKVLLFAFGEELGKNPYLPHNYERDAVVYTGTHDNNTARGWFDDEASAEDRQRVGRYLGRGPEDERVVWALVTAAFSSVARLAVVPMQDFLELGSGARMNRPAVKEGNWYWRLYRESLTDELAAKIRELAGIYGRIG